MLTAKRGGKRSVYLIFAWLMRAACASWRLGAAARFLVGSARPFAVGRGSEDGCVPLTRILPFHIRHGQRDLGPCTYLSALRVYDAIVPACSPKSGGTDPKDGSVAPVAHGALVLLCFRLLFGSPVLFTCCTLYTRGLCAKNIANEAFLFCPDGAHACLAVFCPLVRERWHAAVSWGDGGPSGTVLRHGCVPRGGPTRRSGCHLQCASDANGEAAEAPSRAGVCCAEI